MDDTTAIDLETNEIVEPMDFKTELARSFAICAATTAGMIAGTAAVGFVKVKLDARKARKAEKAAEAALTETTVE